MGRPSSAVNKVWDPPSSRCVVLLRGRGPPPSHIVGLCMCRNVAPLDCLLGSETHDHVIVGGSPRYSRNLQPTWLRGLEMGGRQLLVLVLVLPSCYFYSYRNAACIYGQCGVYVSGTT